MTGFGYKSYTFTDKDPMIDVIHTIIQESGEALSKISYDSGVSHQTIAKWLYGETKQPRASSMNAVLRALGYKLEVVNYSFVPIVKPTFLKEAKVYTLPRKAIKHVKVPQSSGRSG